MQRTLAEIRKPPEARTRTVSWQDPFATARGAIGRSGLEFLRAIIRGEVPAPPMALLLGMDLIEADTGRAVFSVEPAEHHYNPLGTVHGGLAATLLDSAMTCAVSSTLPAGRALTTLELKTNFVRPITAETGPITASGTVLHAGSRTGTAEGKVEDAQGRLLAHGTATFLIFDPSQSESTGDGDQRERS
jgi:uncharacterized protein (TIGR00369 family)